ncbi:MAG TPA: sulfatase [Planctomycetota bacterium]
MRSHGARSVVARAAGTAGRRRALALLLLAPAGSCAPVPPAPVPQAPVPPCVLLISIDTLRADHLGLHGYGRDTSPFLDRWSRDALVFEHAFTPYAWTLVAHMTMLTGLFPTQHGVTGGNLGLSPELPTLAERLQARGYRTVGLYHPGWIHARHGFARGFDVFREHEGVDEAGRHLFEELARLEGQRPWFLFVHVFDVHGGALAGEPPGIYTAPEPYRDRFLPGASARVAHLEREDIVQGRVVPTLAELEALVALYDDGIRQVDDALGGWFDRLEREAALGEALVIVTSDHGEVLGPLWKRGTRGGFELPLTAHGGSWQEGLHVPLIVRPPGGARPGRRIREPAHLVDVAATVLAAAGAPGADLPGRSLLDPLPRERLLSGAGHSVGWILRWPLKVGSAGGLGLAVDLERDPGECAVEHVPLARFQQLEDELGALLLAAPIDVRRLAPDEQAELRALGYAGELEQGR